MTTRHFRFPSLAPTGLRGTSLAVLLSAAALTAQQAPVFRAGVDVIGIEVVVLDKAGTAVATLGAADFTVAAGGRPRRVLAADFVGGGRPVRSAAAARAPIASSNRSAASPRSILFVVDMLQVPAGGGRLAMKSLGAALDRLAPADRVGLMTLSDARVAFTTDRVALRRALGELTGASARLRDREMTMGEATGIAVRDRTALQAYWNRVVDQGYARPGDRSCAPPRGFDNMRDVSADCVQAAEAALERLRLETTRVLERLRSVASALAAHAGPKAIVFVSGGILSEARTRAKLEEVAAEAERSRVSIHAILIEPDGSMAGRSSVESSRFDRQVALAGLGELAGAARGSVHRVQGDAAAAFEQIDRELSGYYVISFERLPEDRDGVRQDVIVRVSRPDVNVLAARGVTPSRNFAAEPAAADPRTGIGDLLRSSAAVTQVPIEVDAFTLPGSSAGADARAIVVVEIERPPPAVAAFGFQIAEHSGRVIADGYHAPAQLQPVGPNRSLYVATVPVGGGRYVSRFAVVDTNGRAGSVEHAFETPARPSGDVEPSDVIFGDRGDGDFRPAALVPPGAGTLPLRLVVRDASGRFDGVAVRAIVTSARDDERVDVVDVPLAPTPDRLRRFADADLRLDRYRPGEYVVTMIVSARGAEIARRQRLFRRQR